jgi:uncharacterized SAM-binding protein YcdF (DUF218 family)
MLSAVATVLLVPPVNLVFLALAGMALARWRPATGRWLTLFALLALVLLALPIVPGLLLQGLEREIPLAGAQAGPQPVAQAIVILGADADATGPSPTQAEVGPLTLQRLRGGAALARASGLPVLVTGGVVSQGAPPVAALMARSLTEDFAAPPRWVEPLSKTTWENAALSAAILRREGIGTVLLVTHPWHMRRALIAFRAAGLAALPAPLPSERAPRLAWGTVVPRVSAWERSYFALHEWIGCGWYALRARAVPPPPAPPAAAVAG